MDPDPDPDPGGPKTYIIREQPQYRTYYSANCEFKMEQTLDSIFESRHPNFPPKWAKIQILYF
jgi:hypothetical protein